MFYVYLQEAALGSPIERLPSSDVDGVAAMKAKGWAEVEFAKWYDQLADDTKQKMAGAPAGSFNDPSVEGQLIDTTTGEPVVPAAPVEPAAAPVEAPAPAPEAAPAGDVVPPAAA